MAERAARSDAGEVVEVGPGNAIAATGMGVMTVSAGAGVGVGAEAGTIPARGTDISQGHEADQEPPRDPRSVADLGLSAPLPLYPRSRGILVHLRRQVKLLS